MKMDWYLSKFPTVEHLYLCNCTAATGFEINFGDCILPWRNISVVCSDFHNLLVQTTVLFYFQKGTVMHELAHAQGILHEQSRFDRDNYVTIMYENIISSAKKSFDKHRGSVSGGFPYDYGSIMHYGDKVIICVYSACLSTPPPPNLK